MSLENKIEELEDKQDQIIDVLKTYLKTGKSPYEFQKEKYYCEFKCESCRWEGKGYEAEVDFIYVDKTENNLICPNCGLLFLNEV